MLCSRCKKSEATVFYKQLVDNKLTERHLCLDCAKAVDVPISPGSPVFDLLLSILGKPQASSPRQARLQCRRCDLAFDEFRKTGLLGCSRCYDSFAKPLDELLKRIHCGPARHAGKTVRDVVDLDAEFVSVLAPTADGDARDALRRFLSAFRIGADELHLVDGPLARLDPLALLVLPRLDVALELREGRDRAVRH